jgi:hypothetical protein
MPNICAPSAANRRAVAAPKPDDAPVTKAIFPLKRAINSSDFDYFVS